MIAVRTTSTGPRLAWRDLGMTVLVPNLLYGLWLGALAPTIPVVALALGASFSTAALVAAALIVGQMACTLPAGWFVTRFSEKTAMVASGVLTGLAALWAYVAPSLAVLCVCVFLMGAGAAVFNMGRHAWITVAIPASVRGRTLAVVAGANRIGQLSGPFIAAAAFALTDQTSSAFIAVAVASLAISALVLPQHFPRDETHLETAGLETRVFATMWTQRGVLLRLGSAVSVIATMRTARRIMVPLVGIALGMDEVAIALLLGIANGIDVSLFYAGGVITDRKGRGWVAVPCLVGFGVSFLAIATSQALDGGAAVFVAATLLMSIGNGISGGVVATIGSDLADPRSPASFLSSWRLITDLGGTVAPLGIAAVTAVGSLAAASASLGALALAAAVLLPGYLRRYLPQPAGDRG